MTSETAINIIKKVYNYCETDDFVNFMFQGGEPLLSGVDFFQEFTENAIKYNSKNLCVNFYIQTNGTLINDDYCKLFKKYNYLVGISLDGNEDIHNMYRCNSYYEVMKNIDLLNKYDISYNILTVITSQTDPHKLFDFYITHGFFYVQLIYCLDNLDNPNKNFVLDAKALARFKKRFFNKWKAFTVLGNKMYVREFYNLINLVNEGLCEQCGYNGKCTPQIVIEADGTIYPCDFYCLDEFKCLNINSCEIIDLFKCEGLHNFINHTEPKNSLCQACEVKNYCNGGCKRYRSLYNSLKGYCPQKDFLLYAIPKISDIKY